VTWASVVRSTSSLVLVRALGMASRYAALLALAALMPAAQFAACALAFVCAEFARVLTDAGVDTVYLRLSETLQAPERQHLAAQAAAIKLLNGSVVVLAMGIALWLMRTSSVLVVLIAMQFLAQSLVQFSLNVLQSQNLVHRSVWPLALLYGATLCLAATGFLGWQAAVWTLPAIAAGELVFAVACVLARLPLRTAQAGVAYERLLPLALPMAGIAVLALVNTRVDSVLVSSLLSADEAGRYMFLQRWSDLTPLLVAGIAMPLVGKIGLADGDANSAQRRRRWRHATWFAAPALVLPFALVWLALVLNPAYSSDGRLAWVVAAVGSVRGALMVSTVILLSRWQDRRLLLIAVAAAISTSTAGWIAGTVWGALGIAVVVLLVEGLNLSAQVALIRLGRRAGAKAVS
jgi:O-antigen/teichoic acid export membrane protein